MALFGRIIGRIFGRKNVPGTSRLDKVIGQTQGRLSVQPAAINPYREQAPKPAVAMAQELSAAEEAIASGQVITLASTWQEALWVDWRSSTIFLQTKSGGVYAYAIPRNSILQVYINGANYSVPIDCVSMALRWIQSPSPGRFWWSYIRPNFSPARRVRAGNKGYKGHRGPRGNVVRIIGRTVHHSGALAVGHGPKAIANG